MSAIASTALPAQFARGSTATLRRSSAKVGASRSSVRAMAGSLHDFKGKTLGGGTRDAPTEARAYTPHLSAQLERFVWHRGGT
jgi:hypothetical protein